MKRFITMLLVLSMVVCMLPTFAISTAAAEDAAIEEGLEATFWLSVSETAEGEAGHFDTWKRVMGWHGGYTTSFENNRKFEQAIGAMLNTSAKTGSKADITEFGAYFNGNDYKAATGINGDNADNGYMVNWKGTMKASKAGTYTFIANKIDNGCYIEIGGEKAFEYWGASYYFDGDENVLSEQTFTITEAQVGQDIEFEMWFLEIDGGEALAMTVTDNGELSGKKSIADAGFTFDLDADYYTCNAIGDKDLGDIEQYMADGVKVDDNGNASSAAEAGNHTFTEDQLDKIKSEMMVVGTNTVKDMDNSAYQDNPVCEQFGMLYDAYMVEYSGFLTPSVTGDYLFGTHRVDNCFLLQLKIDGEWKTVYEFWAKGIFNDRTTTYYNESFDLTAGTSYELRAIFLELGGGQPHQLIAKNLDTGAVYAELSSTMYLTTEAIPAADFTPKAASITLDGDLSDWEGTHTLTVEGTDGFAGKKATWYAVVTDEGVYMACDAYHDIYTTTDGEWHRNTNFEAWIKEPGHVQVWVSAGLNGRASDNVTAFNMTTTSLGDSTPKYHTVTELFISNAQLPADSVQEGVFRAGVAWKTPGDICNNGGANAEDEWWCPKYRANDGKKHIVTADGIFADTDFTVDVATPEELLAYVKMVNANSAIHNNFSNLITLNITADIDMTGYEWTPLNRWIGTINGNGHTLSGLVVVNEATGGNKGLLVNELSNWWDGRPVESGTIKDLTIKDSFIYAPNTEWNGVGGFVGICDRGIIENCTLDDVTVIGGDWTGGIVGRASGGSKDLDDDQPVRDCTVIDSKIVGYATPTDATKAVGAIVGTNDSAQILLGNYTIKNTVVECSDGANRTLAIGAPDTAAERQPVSGETVVEENSAAGAITTAELTAGADQNWDASDSKTISFTVSGTDNSIKSITVGDTVLKTSQYTTVEESEGVTVITLKESLLKKLESGEYTVKIESYEGNVETKLAVVNEVPETGDMSFIIVLVSTLALGAVVVTSKKRLSVR